MDDAPLQTLAAVEEAYLRQALRQHSGNRRSSLARVLRISEGALYRKLSRLRGLS